MNVVSVVIPAYNAASTIARCLASVRAQDYVDLEVIVVDDGSEDGTAEIAKKADGVHVLIQPNAGPASARNRGIAAASGEWIAFLDSDEEWLDPRKLSAQMECALSQGAAIVGALGKDGSIREVSLGRMLLGNPFTTSTVLVSRASVLACGGFEDGSFYSEDFRLWLRIVAGGGKACLCGVRGSADLRGRRSFDSGGLSGRMRSMERAELANFLSLRREGLLGPEPRAALLCAFAMTISMLKYVRRLALRAGRSIRGRR